MRFALIHRMNVAALVLSLLLQDPDVASLIRSLDDADFEVRRNAFQGLVKAGKAALPALQEAIRTTPSPEVRDAAPRAVEAILKVIRDEFIRRHVADPGRLRCGEVSFDTGVFSAQRVKELAAWFPDCEFIRGWFSCMHRALVCDGEWIVGLSRRDGEIFTIRKDRRRGGLELGAPEVLGRRHKPVKDREGAVALARLLTEILAEPQVSQVDGCWRVSWPRKVVAFDASGRFASATSP